MRLFAGLMMAALLAIIFVSSPAFAGTTGSISGHVVDAETQAPIAGARVTAASPSQTETTTTDATGAYAFVSLSPDTYTLTAAMDGYDPTSQPGVSVLADQSQTLTISLRKTASVLGHVKVTGSSGLVRPGVTSNVYSVSGANGQAATALGGSGNLNSAYSQMASVPGVSSVQGQQGWYQPIYIRGGDLDQVGWEFDGIPVNRTYDNAPQTFLSNLGQQELQVYTGGTSPNADASGIAGYVNQVIKRGTYPGFGTLDLGFGGPALYNKASLELGGAVPGGKFSYYVGSSVVSQDFRYVDNFNGASYIDQGYFYPINTAYFGGTNTFTTGDAYGIAGTQDHENVANFHLRVGADDDIQLLYTTSYLYMDYNSSENDLGGIPLLESAGATGPLGSTFSDMDIYNGPLFQAPNTADLTPYLLASTPHAFGALVPTTLRDTNTNADSISKLQYQHNFSTSSYLRVFGFSDYSNWYIHGPESQALFCCYGAELADYELPSHQYGGVADYSNQLNDKNLLTLSALYETTNIQRYTTTGGFPGNNPGLTSDVVGNGSTGQCVNALDVPIDCIPTNGPTYRGPGGVMGNCPTNADPPTCTLADLEPWAAPAGSQWLVTESGVRANLNKVNPVFSALGINDNIKPNDKLAFNIGARVEVYQINLDNSTTDPSLYPARAFWYAAYNNEFCFAPGYFQPLEKASPTDTCSADYPLTSPINEINSNPSSFSHTELQPRFGASYQLGADDVLRMSAGVYSRPASTREASWNVDEQDLAAFEGVNFAAYGQFTPNHDVQPDRSTNFDFSWAHHFAGSDASFRVTPFYRSTQNQVQQTIVNALSGLFASFNTGHQISDGVELAIQKGTFSQDGWAFNLAYTYTHSQIQYNDFSNGRNVIDNINSYVQLYNSYTGSCTGVAPSPSKNSLCGVFGDNSAGSPYLTDKAQPLFDDNAWYEPYDLIPVPWAAGNGYEVPDDLTLLINYKKGPFSVTPSLTYSSGSSYGSPLAWNDCINSSCSHATIFPTALAGNPLMIPDPYTGVFDNFGAFKQPSRITANMSFGEQISPKVHAVLTVSNLIDQCSQRGYAWDFSEICSYSTLPSSFLTPTGGTVANAATGPVQLRYPYAMWLNNNNTGFVGVKMPIEESLDVQFKL
jgi:hypothetical protein